MIEDDPLTLTAPAPAPAHVTVPLDIYKAIERVAEREASNPFVARRLAAHYRQGIWAPQDDQRSKQ